MNEMCTDCQKEKLFRNKKFCTRDADVKCLICGDYLCGGHIGLHLKKKHCVALTNEHCLR